MTDANTASSNTQDKDAKQAVGTCPFKKNKIQLIPLRYALVEEPQTHQSIRSKLSETINFRPVGARKLHSEGYIYVIHSKRQDIIYAFKTDDMGNVTKIEQQQMADSPSGQEYIYIESENGLFVERSGFIEVLYSHTPISPKLQSQLLSSQSLRSKMMQQCNLGGFDCTNGSTHLLPINQLSEQLSDCHPEKSSNPEDFQWCWLQEAPKAIAPESLINKIHSEYKEDSAFLVLEDPINIMSELACSYINISNQEIEWLKEDNNDAKYFAASQIKILTTITEQTFSNDNLSDKYHTYLKDNFNEVFTRYNEYHKAKEAKNRFNQVLLSKQRHVSLNGSEVLNSNEYINFQNQMQKIRELAVKMDIELESQELVAIFDQVKSQHDDLLEGASLGSRGILDRIEHEQMETWFNDAKEKIKRWREQTDNIEQDRVATLKYAYDSIPVFDKENKDYFLARLETENLWLANLAETDENKAKVKEFFFASLGEQNLQTFIVNKKNMATLEEADLGLGELIAAKGVKDSHDDANDAYAGINEFQKMLAGKHLIDMSDVPDNIKQQLNVLGSQLGGLAIDELNELKESLENYENRAKNLLHHARPGIVALLLGHRSNANVSIDIGTADNTHVDGLLSELEEIRSKMDQARSNRNKVESNTSGTQEQKDARRAAFDQELSDLNRQSIRALNDLDAAVVPVASTNPDETPRSRIIIKADGATSNDISELLELRKRVLKNELLYGVSEGKGLKGSYGSGSLALVMFVLNYMNWSESIDKANQKSLMSLPQQIELISNHFALLTATTSLCLEIIKTKATLDWINSTSTSSAKNVMKTVAIGNVVVSGLAFVSTVLDGYKFSRRITKSWNEGNIGGFISSSIALTGVGIQGWHTGKVAFKGGRYIVAGIAEKHAWRTVTRATLGLVARANPATFVATALIFAGEIAWNFFQSTALMKWVSQCAWGKNGALFWHKNQNWDYNTQLLKWLELTQSPQVTIDSNVRLKTTPSPTGSYVITREEHQLNKLRIKVPMAQPHQVKIAGYIISTSRTAPSNETETLLSNSSVNYDGIATTLEIDWPQSSKKWESLLYLDLLIEVKSQTGEVLFAEQNGARYTINLKHPVNTSKISDNWKAIKILDGEDMQLTSNKSLTSSLSPLRNINEQSQK